jgi:DNA-binding response OmpR family regulator
MSPHQLLFLTSDCNAAALWLAGLDQFDRTYSISIASLLGFSTEAAGGFDLIIIEVEADTMTEALDTCQRLSSKTNGPLLVLSSMDDEDYAVEVYKSEADEYILKPIGLSLLHAKVKAWQRWIVPAAEPALSNNMQDSKKSN